jgi:hypothetical protein
MKNLDIKNNNHLRQAVVTIRMRELTKYGIKDISDKDISN